MKGSIALILCFGIIFCNAFPGSEKIDSISNDGGKAQFYQAVATGDDKLAETLINNGADINIPDNSSGITPLQAAVQADHEKIVGMLIEHGVKIDATDKKGRTALHLAAENVYDKIAELLLDNGIDVNATDEVGSTALHRAAEHGHTKVAEILIKKGVNINQKDSYGCTAFHRSAEHGTIDVARLLVENKAELNIRDNDMCTPLYWAEKNGHLREFESMLRELGKKINFKVIEDDYRSLIRPIQEGDLARVQRIAKLFGDYHINLTLSVATMHGRAEIVEFLIGIGANVNPCARCDSPLHLAIERDNAKIAELLIKNKADVNLRDKDGETPIFDAVRNGNANLTELLIKNGADLNVKSKWSKKSVLEIAVDKNESVIPILIENGARIDDKTDNKLFFWAIKKDNEKIIDAFIENVPNILNSTNEMGEKPLIVARSTGNEKIVQKLISHGAICSLHI